MGSFQTDVRELGRGAACRAPAPNPRRAPRNGRGGSNLEDTDAWGQGWKVRVETGSFPLARRLGWPGFPPRLRPNDIPRGVHLHRDFFIHRLVATVAHSVV